MPTLSEKAVSGLGPVRNRDTIRCVVPVVRREEITKDFFVEKILFGLLKFGPREVLSLQHFPSQGTFEVTFRSTEWLQLGKRRLGENVTNVLLDGLKFSASDVYATVIVHAFNPHTAGEDIATYLRRYCAEVREGVKLIDKHGLWNCRRRYKVRFRTKADGATTIYPPYSFYLGPDKCHVIIEGQPGACWKCGAVGHRMLECEVRRCRHCDSTEHMASACSALRTCSLCGSTEHLYRMCPLRGKEAQASSEAPGLETVENVGGGVKLSGEGSTGTGLFRDWAHVVAEGSPFVFAGEGPSGVKVKSKSEGPSGVKAKSKTKFAPKKKKKKQNGAKVLEGQSLAGVGKRPKMGSDDSEEEEEAELHRPKWSLHGESVPGAPPQGDGCQSAVAVAAKNDEKDVKEAAAVSVATSEVSTEKEGESSVVEPTATEPAEEFVGEDGVAEDGVSEEGASLLAPPAGEELFYADGWPEPDLIDLADGPD